jgi:hypothetical protein
MYAAAHFLAQLTVRMVQNIKAAASVLGASLRGQQLSKTGDLLLLFVAF